jgi:hypothetical protein
MIQAVPLAAVAEIRTLVKFHGTGFLPAGDKEGLKTNPLWRNAIADQYSGCILIRRITDVRSTCNT